MKCGVNLLFLFFFFSEQSTGLDTKVCIEYCYAHILEYFIFCSLSLPSLSITH